MAAEDTMSADAAGWTPAMLVGEPDGLPSAERTVRDGYELDTAVGQDDDILDAHIASELDRFAIRAEAARRLETRAADRARAAQRLGDRRGLEGAREQVLAAERARLDATAEAYDVAAVLQATGLDDDAPLPDIEAGL